MGIFEKVKGSGEWWILFYDERGKRHREKVGKKARANELYKKRKEECRVSKLFPEQRQSEDRRVTVNQLLERVWPFFEKTRSKADNQRYSNYWAKQLGESLAVEIRPSELEKVRNSLTTAGKKPATVNRYVAFLKRAYNLAKQDGLDLGNPVAKLKQFQENNERVRFLEMWERDALEASSPPHHWDWIQIGFYTGLRQAEQCKMRRENVDLGRSLLTVPLSKHGQKRIVKLCPAAVEILERQLASHSQDWVWPGRKPGTSIHSQSLIHAIRDAVKKAKMTDFHWHDLRHDYCSQLVMAGTDIRTVQVLAGHKTLSVTLRYAHLAPSHLQEAVDRLDFRKKKEPPQQPPD